MDKRIKIKMIPGSEGPPTEGATQESSDETLELELTPTQELILARAANAISAPPSSAPASPGLVEPFVPLSQYANFSHAASFASRRTDRVDFVCNVTFAVVTLAVAVALLWPASARHLPLPVVTPPAPLVKVIPAAPAEPQGTPVRIRNAFDSMEVFEFPPGTTETAARAAVAELLLSRAHDRVAARLALKRSRELASDRGTAVQQPEVFVTRLLAGAKDPVSGAN